jgi:hypothetical protein
MVVTCLKAYAGILLKVHRKPSYSLAELTSRIQVRIVITSGNVLYLTIKFVVEC